MLHFVGAELKPMQLSKLLDIFGGRGLGRGWFMEMAGESSFLLAQIGLSDIYFFKTHLDEARLFGT